MQSGTNGTVTVKSAFLTDNDLETVLFLQSALKRYSALYPTSAIFS